MWISFVTGKKDAFSFDESPEKCKPRPDTSEDQAPRSPDIARQASAAKDRAMEDKGRLRDNEEAVNGKSDFHKTTDAGPSTSESMESEADNVAKKATQSKLEGTSSISKALNISQWQ